MFESERTLIGIFGGTFAHIHYGHLRAAEEIIETVGLHSMRFIPAGEPCLRSSPVASSKHRMEMLRLAIKNNPKFILDDREILRQGPSYTIDSLCEIKQELGETAALCFVIGVDAFTKLFKWHNWQELFRLCHFIIIARPGYILGMNHGVLSSELNLECLHRQVSTISSLRRISSGLIFIAPTTMLDISATSIRAHVAAGKSAHYMIPDVVFDYIVANQLYSGEK